MVDADERPAAEGASAMFEHLDLPQFWDGSRRLGREVGASIGVPDWVAWDIYLFYRPGTEWTDDGLPPPAAFLAQVDGRVVAGRGTLAPRGDQAALSPRLRGQAVVVGGRADLPALLAEVAARFARPAAAGP